MYISNSVTVNSGILGYKKAGELPAASFPTAHARRDRLVDGRKVAPPDITAAAPPFHRPPPSITVPDLVLVKR